MTFSNKTQKITACAFIHKGGKLLVAKRAETKKFLPGKYELPGGHIEFGETMEEGLRREIREEFGAEIRLSEPFYIFTYVCDGGLTHTVEVDYFASFVDPEQEIRLNPEDHSEFRWIGRLEVPDYFAADDEEGKAARIGFELLSRKYTKKMRMKMER